MQSLVKINDDLINGVLKKAQSSSRKRTNYNFHKSYDAPLQRMLNAAEPGTYIRPHKHENPDKIVVAPREWFGDQAFNNAFDMIPPLTGLGYDLGERHHGNFISRSESSVS